MQVAVPDGGRSWRMGQCGRVRGARHRAACTRWAGSRRRPTAGRCAEPRAPHRTRHTDRAPHPPTPSTSTPPHQQPQEARDVRRVVSAGSSLTKRPDQVRCVDAREGRGTLPSPVGRPPARFPGSRVSRPAAGLSASSSPPAGRLSARRLPASAAAVAAAVAGEDVQPRMVGSGGQRALGIRLGVAHRRGGSGPQLLTYAPRCKTPSSRSRFGGSGFTRRLGDCGCHPLHFSPS